MRYLPRYLLVVLFAMAMAMVEAAVVAYLRALYYPGGWELNLKPISQQHLAIEVGREAATLVMLATVAGLVGRERWERFGWFIVLFGIWDIFYYAWLKVAINWPPTLLEWDVLFLIPLPWLGPVLAPVIVSAVMIVTGTYITRLYPRKLRFQPTLTSWLVAAAATAVILFTFMRNSGKVVAGVAPEPYWYGLFALGILMYLLAFWWSYRRVVYNP